MTVTNFDIYRHNYESIQLVSTVDSITQITISLLNCKNDLTYAVELAERYQDLRTDILKGFYQTSKKWVFEAIKYFVTINPLAFDQLYKGKNFVSELGDYYAKLQHLLTHPQSSLSDKSISSKLNNHLFEMCSLLNQFDEIITIPLAKKIFAIRGVAIQKLEPFQIISNLIETFKLCKSVDEFKESELSAYKAKFLNAEYVYTTMGDYWNNYKELTKTDNLNGNGQAARMYAELNRVFIDYEKQTINSSIPEKIAALTEVDSYFRSLTSRYQFFAEAHSALGFEVFRIENFIDHHQGNDTITLKPYAAYEAIAKEYAQSSKNRLDLLPNEINDENLLAFKDFAINPEELTSLFEANQTSPNYSIKEKLAQIKYTVGKNVESFVGALHDTAKLTGLELFPNVTTSEMEHLHQGAHSIIEQFQKAMVH